MTPLQSILVGLAAIAASFHYTGLWIPTRLSQSGEIDKYSCRPFLPKLFVETPPAPDHAVILGASRRLGEYLTKRFAKGDIDSLSVAVVTSGGALFEENYGVVRGNESASSSLTTSHSQYRIASTAKLFTAMEGLVLEQRGALSWDNPVEKYLPEFKYRLSGFDPSSPSTSTKDAPITLFQLASHMSGLGRDWPVGTVPNWPKDVFGMGPPPTNGLPFPDHAALYNAVSKTGLTSPPFTYPAYSNTGTALLGMALVAANRAASKDPAKEPTTYAELVRRDLFDTIGMNDSHFLATEANKHLVVTPSFAPEVVDQDFLDAMNPAAGQFSSLYDSIKVVQTLLNPNHPSSPLTRYSMDKWLHPVHVFEEDDWTEIGFMWEIIKAQDSNNRLRKIYWKLGAMAGYHSALAIHPGTSYGVVVYLAGNYFDAAKVAYDVFEIFQPAIDGVLAEMSTALYAGLWTSEDGDSLASIVVNKGTLYMERFISNGTDVLGMFRASGQVALRSSQRRDEFRLDTGIPGYNGLKHMGCYVYWNGQDLWGHRNNAPLNLLYFTGNAEQRSLHFPSTDVVMRRK